MTLVSVVPSAEVASVADTVVAVGTVVADTSVAAIAILVGAAPVVAIGVAGLVAHTMAVKGAIGVAVLVDYS